LTLDEVVVNVNGSKFRLFNELVLAMLPDVDTLPRVAACEVEISNPPSRMTAASRPENNLMLFFSDLIPSLPGNRL
jgi:hypothetical protein